MSHVQKLRVLSRIANGGTVSKERGHGPAKWRIGCDIIHVRWRTNPKLDNVTYSYGINPNTLSADYELWICGGANMYYLIPISTIRTIYNDSDTYPDHQHQEIRVADINTLDHRAQYWRGGKSLDFRAFFCSTL